MIIYLGKFNNINSHELSIILNYYQEYFTFKINKDDTYLYLDTTVLKYYLKNGLNIKYRKYIFLFLKNNLINNNTYKFLEINNYIFLKDSQYNFNKILNNIDIKNLELIVNLSNKIYKNKNKFSLRNKNIIKLENNFFVNIELGRFYIEKVKDNIYTFNGIILNYINNIKNKILPLLSIDYINKLNLWNKDKNKKNSLQFNTKCNLIITDKSNIKLWELLIKTYLNNYKIYVISTIKNFKKILNKDIFNYDFLIINTSLVSSLYFKKYFSKYNTIDNIDNSNNITIVNSLCDNIVNKNIDNENLNRLYLFEWNNIIYDNIEKIKDNDKNNYINYLTCSYTKYYILNNYFDNSIADYIIKNSIYENNNLNNLFNKNNITITYDNFYYFIKDQLLIDNNESVQVKIKYIFHELFLSDNEKDTYNILFEGDGDEYNKEKISLFYIESFKYNFNLKNIKDINNNIEEYYNRLIKIDEDKLETINLLSYEKNEINELYKPHINDLQNKINLYKLKLQYFKNILIEFNDKEYYCTVCLENIDKNNFCIINCGHYFCKDCLKKYINEKKDVYECPICRENFNDDNIYINKISDNNILYQKNSTKINKLNEIINLEENKKIIIVSQYKQNIVNIRKFINKDILIYNLHYKNNYLKEKNINLFNNEINKCILFVNYTNILKNTYNNISSIIFIDYPDIDYNSDNQFSNIKKNFLEKYSSNNIIYFYFLYINDSYEKDIIDKYIK
jgi:hypothetical protein